MITLTTFSDASEFVAAVRPTLSQHEAEHHLMLGVAEAGATTSPNATLIAMTARDGDGLVAALWYVKNRPVLLATDRESIADAVPLFCNALEQAHARPSHVIGGVAQAGEFAREWSARVGGTPSVAMEQRTYRLDRVVPLPATAGQLRAATSDDLDLIAEWMAEFEREALSSLPQVRTSRDTAARRIAAGEIYVWCDPDPRTMAASARPTERVVAVNGVFTPPKWRGRGYATSCVAALSTRLLERYECCVLYTDLANPTSNAIYTRIGYRPIKDVRMYSVE